MAQNITLTFSNITNNNTPCKDPIIYIHSSTGPVAYPCGDKIGADGKLKITVPDDTFTSTCITGIIKCDSCGSCPEQDFSVCLCETSADCPACSVCENGVCIELCPDKKCINGQCADCDTNSDCPLGFVCIGGECVCYGVVNERGECVDCRNNSDCGPCSECQNGQCVPTACPGNLICINGDCGCPSGTKYDVTTQSCIPVGCNDDSQCDECETCVSGTCQPIICPEGYKCVGGECIFWPCADTSCNNGADCGQDCGCLNGECVPCYLLECTGECAEALGCKCNANTDKCEPVKDCNQYCDGSTPCLDENCTCYNNRCVSCENFPCTPDDCSSRPNCGCNGGDCGGGNGCNDTITFRKEENCATNECGLLAEFTTEKSCGCDPIEIRIKNIKTCDLNSTRPSSVLLNLEASLYKNNIPYADYLKELAFGDNELVQGTLVTTVRHFVRNSLGAWQETQVTGVVQPERVSAIGNAFDVITIGTNNVKDQLDLSPTKVVIEVSAVGFKIPENGCVDYDSKLIASYELDFSNYAATCTKISGVYKQEQKSFLTDNSSARTPLFVYSKSTTGTFATTEFIEDGTYAKSGWFYKEYGVKVGNKWVSKVNRTEDGLVNNYNYKVSVDCGCKATQATLEKVVFCCPKDFRYELTQCGRKITVYPFSTCAVNKKLATQFPKETQTLYYVTLNGQDFILRAGGGELLQNFVKELPTPITTIEFSQRYDGTPLIAKACDITYTAVNDAPDFDLTFECGKITVTQIPNTNPITGVRELEGNKEFTKVTGQNKWELVIDKVTKSYEVATTFQNTCVFVKTADVVCEPVVEATPTSLVAKGECPTGGTNPNILLEATAGFTGIVEFFDPRTNEWVTQTGTNPSKVTLSNFAAGTYTFVARQQNNTSITASVTVTINPPVDLQFTSEPACGNQSGKLRLQGAIGSTWKITGQGFPSAGTNVVIPPGGLLDLPVTPANAGGLFTATFVSDPTNTSCGGTKTVTVAKDGGPITATIQAPNVICKGAPATFKINDNGLGLTYVISATTSGVVFTGLNGNKLIGGQNATVTYSGPNSTFTISAVLDSATPTCYTTTIANKTITANATPIITSASQCVPGEPGAYNITVVWSNRPGSAILDLATVTVGSDTINLNNFPNSSNTYIASALLSGGQESYTISATYEGCTTTLTVPFVLCNDPNNCPPLGQPTVVANPQYPCGVQTSYLIYSGGTVPENGDIYTWIDTTTGLDVVLNTGTVSGGAIPDEAVTAQVSPKTYKLRITKNSGVCSYESANVEVQAQTAQNVVIYGPGILPDTQTLTSGIGYTFFTDIIGGATYNWVLTNPGGSTTNLGTAFQATTTLLPGASVITVTVTVDGCVYTKSENLVVETNCAGEVLVALTGTGSDTCKDISGTVSNIVGTVVSWEWKVDGLVTQSGTGTIVNFNAEVITPGDTVDITLEVTTSTGCLIISNELEYTRCSCLCKTDNTCGTTIMYTGFGGEGLVATLPEFPAGKQLSFLTVSGNVDLNVADRYQIIVTNGGSTTILDTGYPHTIAVPNLTACPGVNYPLLVTDLSSYILGDDVSADMIAAVNPVIISQLTTINLTMDYTTVAGDVITIIHNDALCTSQQGWRVDVTCLN